MAPIENNSRDFEMTPTHYHCANHHYPARQHCGGTHYETLKQNPCLRNHGDVVREKTTDDGYAPNWVYETDKSWLSFSEIDSNPRFNN